MIFFLLIRDMCCVIVLAMRNIKYPQPYVPLPFKTVHLIHCIKSEIYRGFGGKIPMV